MLYKIFNILQIIYICIFKTNVLLLYNICTKRFDIFIRYEENRLKKYG